MSSLAIQKSRRLRSREGRLIPSLPLEIYQRKGAFTLIELLVVISIIGVLTTFLAPSMNTIMRGSQLTQGGRCLSINYLLPGRRHFR